MSYILDALKKSELARQQDRALDIMTVPAAIAVSSRQARRARLRAALAASGVVVLLVLLAWWRPWQASGHLQDIPVDAQPPPSSRPSTLTQTATGRSVDPAPGHAGQPASMPRQPADRATPADPAPVPSKQPASTPRQPADRAMPVDPVPVLPKQPASTPRDPAERAIPAAPAQHAALAEASVAVPLPPAREPVRAMGGEESQPASVINEPSLPSLPRSAALAPVPPDRVISVHELPDSIRRALPALQVAGFSHGNEPSARLAVINDRIRREGDGVGDGVILEQVTSEGIVLSFRGFRFRP